jgi:hypothetical protein
VKNSGHGLAGELSSAGAPWHAGSVTRSIVLGLAAVLALTVVSCSKKTSPPNQSANALDLKDKQPTAPSPIPIPYPNVAASREAGSGQATGRRQYDPVTVPKVVK